MNKTAFDTIVNASRVKLLNRYRVLWEVRRSPGVSRRELSRRLNSTDTMLSRITRDLIADGLLLEQAKAHSATRGRPNIGLFLNPSGLHVLSIVLSRHEHMVSITDLSGQRVAENDFGAIDNDGNEAIVSCISRLTSRLREQPEMCFKRFAGVVLIVSPDVEVDQNRWLLPLQARLQETFGAPVVRAAVAEALHIAEIRQTPDLPALPSVMVHAGFALDASIIVSGDGSAGAVFEGNLNDVPIRFDLETDDWQTLNDVVSAGALMQRLGHTEQTQDASLRGLSLGVPHAIRQANSGDPRASLVFRQAGETVGMAIAPVVSILMPASVILAGPLASAVPFLDGFRSILGKSLPGARTNTTITRSTLSDLRAAELAGLEWFAFSDQASDNRL